MHLRRYCLPPLLFVALACAPVLAAPDEPLPKAEQILDRFVEVTGGKAAYEKVHNEKWTGTFEFLGKGIKGAVTSYRAEPNKSVSIIELEGIGTIQEGTDGTTAWESSSLQGPRIKLGDERAVSLREATLRGPLYWRKLYKHAETIAVETIDGQACYKVVLTPEEGKPETQYFDKKSSLMVKTTMTITGPMGEIPSEMLLSDYKEDAGLLQPHKVHQKAMQQEILITLDHVEYNVDMPTDRFDLPADVKALTSKKE
jgi:zinc protease